MSDENLALRIRCLYTGWSEGMPHQKGLGIERRCSKSTFSASGLCEIHQEKARLEWSSEKWSEHNAKLSKIMANRAMLRARHEEMFGGDEEES